MRARNMQALTVAVQSRYPGVTVYGVGDAAHKTSSSDHNEDDTPGSRAEQSDADSNPEHRAIDIMVGPHFTKADGDALVARLLADPASRARLKYIIWHGYIWTRSSGWKKARYNGSDQHTNHVHVSGMASDDENAAGWSAVGGERRRDLIGLKYKDTGEEVRALQYTLEAAGYDVGTVDGDYMDKTAAAVKACCGGPDGKLFVGIHFARLLTALAEKHAGKGEKGDPGPKGDKGDKGDPGTLPATVRLEGSATISAG